VGHPSVSDRLQIISETIQTRKDIREYLELLQKVLLAQLQIDETPNKGAKCDWKEQLFAALVQKTLEAKKPMIHFLNPERFDVDILKAVFRDVLEIFISTYPEQKGLQTLLGQLDRGTVDLLRWFQAALSEEGASIIQWADKYEIESSLLFFLINAPLQPFIEELARRASSSFYDRWWQACCPICGRMPRVAHLRNRRRYLTCTYCGAEYRSDLFLCVNCENKDPYTLKYLRIEGRPEFQIDFCTKCKNYLKVIIDRTVPEPIPGFLADILTLNLDVQAKHADLIRHGTDY
jgi:FdhE protein